MKKSFYIFLTLIIANLIIFSCSEDQNPAKSLSHPDDWNTVGSANFHGKKTLASGYASCKSCHGADLQGGDTGFSCFQCHQTYPHPEEWNKIGDPNHHGKSKEDCKGCHGDDYDGGKQPDPWL